MTDRLEPIRRILRDRGHYELAANDSLCAELLAEAQPAPAACGATDLDRAIAAAREALRKSLDTGADAARWVALEVATHNLLAALDAARGEAVAWPTGVLNRDETLRVLSDHNAWRRGAEGEQTDPRLLGLALDAAIAFIAAPPAAAVPAANVTPMRQPRADLARLVESIKAAVYANGDGLSVTEAIGALELAKLELLKEQEQ